MEQQKKPFFPPPSLPSFNVTFMKEDRLHPFPSQTGRGEQRCTEPPPPLPQTIPDVYMGLWAA